MNQLPPEAQKRCEEQGQAQADAALEMCEKIGYPTSDEPLCILVDETYQAGWKSGFNDPDAGKHVCDDECLRDENINCPISYPTHGELMKDIETFLEDFASGMVRLPHLMEQSEELLEKLRARNK